jgi:ornithine cyclodeaminase/alanine dehydrogenase-like protein (mu-crystallin family)
MRVGADGGIGVKYLANEDAEVVGMLGSGGMARTHMQAFTRMRTIKKLQLFSPTKENRERFGREMAAKYNIEVKVCERPEDIYSALHVSRSRRSIRNTTARPAQPVFDRP